MRIALLDDDADIQTRIGGWLTESGHDCHTYGTSRDFMRDVSRESFDLFLLDSCLPDIDGPDVLRWLRADRNDTTPVIFITARDSEQDIVAGLAGGADDYLVKPVRRAELLARIDALMRRVRPAPSHDLLEYGPYRFEPLHKRLLLEGQQVQLTDKEFDLAYFLFRNMGRLISRGHLLEAVWGRNPSIATRTVDTHISRVRSKLELKPERGFRLVPTYNYGYRLEGPDGSVTAQ